MKLSLYIKEKIGFIFVCVMGIALSYIVLNLAIDHNNTDYTKWCFYYGYSLLLWAFLIFIILTIDFMKCKKIYNQLRNLIGIEGVDYTICLPYTENPIEKTYTELLIQLRKNTEKQLCSFEEQKKEDLDFLQTWVHEIKTPIAASKLLIENGMEHPDEAILYKISDEIENIEEMIEKTIYYSQINDFEKDCQIDELNLERVVNKSLKKEFANIHEKQMKIHINHLDCTVYSDEKWLIFIIKQIIDNAIKYSKPQSIITIYGQQLEKKKSIIVKDEGIGIRKEDQRRVFEKGYTGINGRNNMSATGIGLYLSNKLAQKLGHKIIIRSKLDEGTEVEIQF